MNVHFKKQLSNALIIAGIFVVTWITTSCEKTVTEIETVYDTIYQHDTIFFYDTLYQTDTLIDTVIFIPDSAEVSYSMHIQPIWNQYCIACHNQYDVMNLEPNFSYGNIVPDRIDDQTPENSSIYSIISSGRMPPGDNDLTKVELAYLLEWIKRGTPDN